MPAARSSRLLASGALVLALSVASVLAARGRYTPYSPESPPHRRKGSGKVVIVEYSDFQCPACAAAYGPLKQIQAIYGKGIQIHFKYYPLERIHKSARNAARGAECAGRQGRFWELHDVLFERQPQWPGKDDVLHINDYAHSLGLDMTAFQDCMADPAVDAAIDADVEEGDDRWVRSTPTFFIDGKRFVGAHQLRTLGTIWLEKRLRQ